VVLCVGAVLALLGVACRGGTATPRGSGDPVIVAAGDIACDPADGSFAGGQGTAGACRQAATSDVAVAENPTAVLALGDLQYDCGGTQAFAASYDPTWGRLKAITHPVPGNQEYDTSGTNCPAENTAYGYFQYFGDAAGPLLKGWYSFDLGGWHVIALNANCDMVEGCDKGSPQYDWLRRDLASDTAACTLAFWHEPRFSSGSHNNDSQMADVWTALYHGTLDNSIEPNSQVRDTTSFGVLEMTLHPDSYDWRFVPAAGGTFTDQGSATCH
jgi:hypothetical protein